MAFDPKNHRNRFCAGFLSLALALTPGFARAQSAHDRATARQLADDAEKKSAVRDYDAAYALFAKAFALVPAPTLSLAMGRVKRSLGQLIEAQQLFLDASHSTPSPNEPASWSAARVTAGKEAAAVGSRIPLVDLVLEGITAGSLPPSLRVLVDNEELKGVRGTDIPRAVNPGTHTMRAEAEGYRTAENTIKLGEGERKRVPLKLEALPGELPVPVVSALSAPRQSTPRSLAPSVEPTERTPWNGVTATGLVVLGVFGAAGGVTGFVSKSEVDDIKTSCNPLCPANRQQDAKNAKLLGTLSTVSFGVAGAGLLLTVYGLLQSSPKPAPPVRAANLDVRVGPFGASLEGRF